MAHAMQQARYVQDDKRRWKRRRFRQWWLCTGHFAVPGQQPYWYF